MYQERFYRHQLKKGFSLEVAYKESDIYITTDEQLDKEYVQSLLVKYYNQIEDYIKKNPEFFSSLVPLSIDKEAPPIIQDMLKAAKASGLGPMASVAGAMAHYVGKELLTNCNELIIENGGDIFLKIKEDKKIGLYLGEGFIPQNVYLQIKKRDYAFGICSSSAKIGPSLNFGKADLLTIIGKDSINADAFATSYSNKIKKQKDINTIIEQAKDNNVIEAIFVAFENKLFFWGDIKIAQ